jgi:hypothetical protein
MATTAPSKPVPKHRVTFGRPADREPARTSRPEPAYTAASTPRGRGSTTLFQVPFASAMSDPDIALLARTLGLTTHTDPRLSPSPNGPGAVRLDHHSGLS